MTRGGKPKRPLGPKGSPLAPWNSRVVVFASGELTARQKITWLRHHDLDRGGEGAWASAATMGVFLGMSERTVERMRFELVEAGLLMRQGKTRRALWLTFLPPEARLEEAADDRLLDRLPGLVDQLDGHVKRCRADPSSRPSASHFPSGAGGNGKHAFPSGAGGNGPDIPANREQDRPDIAANRVPIPANRLGTEVLRGKQVAASSSPQLLRQHPSPERARSIDRRVEGISDILARSLTTNAAEHA
jgi:hypothetical protein